MAQQQRLHENKKCFCTTKGMVTILKRQPREWEKIYASYTSDKGLITKIYKEPKKAKLPGKSMTQ
jgi:hypothetical protein